MFAGPGDDVADGVARDDAALVGHRVAGSIACQPAGSGAAVQRVGHAHAVHDRPGAARHRERRLADRDAEDQPAARHARAANAARRAPRDRTRRQPRGTSPRRSARRAARHDRSASTRLMRSMPSSSRASATPVKHSRAKPPQASPNALPGASSTPRARNLLEDRHAVGAAPAARSRPTGTRHPAATRRARPAARARDRGRRGSVARAAARNARAAVRAPPSAARCIATGTL